MALNTGLLLPGAFNQKTDNWTVYKEQMLFALQALGVQDNLESARAIFLSQCGKETFAFLNSLVAPRKLVEVGFKEILAVLDGFFAPEKSEILEAGKFHTRCQQKGETIQAFISAIKTLALKCNFVDLERQLRDRLVLGVMDVRLRRELLKAEKLTFTQAVGRSVSYEQTAADLYPPQQQTSAPLETRPTNGYEPMDTCNVNVGSRKRETACRHCGANHNSRGCKFAKANCNYCRKVGHTVAVCWSRKKRVNLVEVEESDSHNKEEFSYMDEILQIHTKSDIQQAGDKILTTVMLDDKQIQFEVDSGAARTIISFETWKQLQLKSELQEAKINLITWTRQPIMLKGTLEIVVQYKGLKHKLPLLVAEGKGPNILGRDWFETLGIEVQGLCWTDQIPEGLRIKFPKVFHEQLGCYTGKPVKLMLKTGAQPRFLKCRPIPFALKDEVKVELKRLESIGVLTPVRYSDWATPLRIVRKEDGTLRICGDYRSTVNVSIDCDMYPLPTSTEAFQLLAGGKLFSKLDLKQAYTQLLMDEESAEILTWNTPLGLMKVNRLAFGVNAAPGIFQRVMSSQFADMDGVAVLLDDIVVTGANKTEHAERLDKVLQRIEELGFTLNIKKCHFEVPAVTFLGYVLDANGIHPCPKKTKEIQEKLSPSNLKELRAFLGLFNFYERFYKDKSDILEPLHQLLKKDSTWKWGEPEEEAFKKAKQLLSSDLTLIQFDKNKELVLTCDASEYGVGAVISHILDDGQERPIAMSSRTMQPHERKYSQLDKEALAIMFGIRKFQCYLGGMRFIIITDHKPLVGLLNPRKPIPDLISPRLLRWSLILAGYNYDIVYRPGQQIQNADGLSRWCSSEPVRAEAPLPEVLLLEEAPEGWTISAEDIARETRGDELLKKVMFFVLHGWPSEVNDRALLPYSQRKEAISVSKDCLLFSNRVIIPEKLQSQVLSIIHAPHAGIVRSKAYARAYVYWPGMDADIAETVELCEPCQLTRNNPPATLREWSPSEKPWQRLHIDFAGPYMNKIFLIVIDAHSKWPEVEILPSMAAANVIQCLRKIFAEQGLPDMIVSDNGTSFVSDEFQRFLKRNSIEHRTSPPYHPSSNGQAERTVQTIKNNIKCRSDLPWPERLAKLLYHLRTLPSSVTGKTPAEVLNNRKFRTALSTLHPEAICNKRMQTPNKRLRQFSVGETVYIRRYNNNMEKWMKGIVVEQRGLTIYAVKTEDGVVHQRHVDQMRARREQSMDQGSESEVTRDPMRGMTDGWTTDSSQEPDLPIVIPPENTMALENTLQSDPNYQLTNSITIKEELDNNIVIEEHNVELQLKTETEEPYQIQEVKEEIEPVNFRKYIENKILEEFKVQSEVDSILPIIESEEESSVKQECLEEDAMISYDFPNFDDGSVETQSMETGSIDSNDAAALGNVETCLNEDAVSVKYENDEYDDPHLNVKEERDLTVTETHLISNKMINTTSTITNAQDGLIESQTTKTLVMEIHPMSHPGSVPLSKMGNPEEILSTNDEYEDFLLNSITGNELTLEQEAYGLLKAKKRKNTDLEKSHQCPKCVNAYRFAHALQKHLLVHATIENRAKGVLQGQETRRLNKLKAERQYRVETRKEKKIIKKPVIKIKKKPVEIVKKKPVEIAKKKPVEIAKKEGYECTCGKVFRRRSRMETCLRSHNLFAEVKTYPCPTCAKHFKDKTELTLHRKRFHIKKKFPCKFCPTDYNTPKELFKHLQVHQKVQLMEYKVISEIVKGKNKLRCFMCSKTCMELSGLKSHVMEDHKEPYICQHCKQTFPKIIDFANHTKTSHPEVEGQSVLDVLEAFSKLVQAWKCEECELQFHEADKLAMHQIEKHSSEVKSELQFQCNDCRRVFITQKGLTSHRRVHHSTEEPQVKDIVEQGIMCLECRKICKDMNALTSHMRLHSPERKYPCKFCEFRFATPEKRKSHAEIHTGDMKYVCFICEYQCTSENRLKQHKVSAKHSNMKEYLLTGKINNESTQQEKIKASQSKSVKKKKKEEPSPQIEATCEVCGERFPSEEAMLEHKQTHPFIEFPNDDTPSRIFFK